MSGPKVVRVVTREELVAAGEALLRRLNAALSDWEKCAVGAGAIAAEQTASRERRDALERMLRQDKFDEFARAASSEVDFLEVDVGKRMERAARARAQEEARLQSGSELARALLRQVGPGSKEKANLERAAAGELNLKEVDAVLARARQNLFQSKDPQASAAQKALAARLAAGEHAEDFETWRARAAAASPRLVALLAHVAELELLGQAERAVELHRQVLSASAVEDEGVRDIRIDSLLKVLRTAKEDAVALGKMRRQVSLLAAEAAQMPGAVDIVKVLEAAAKAPLIELRATLESASRQVVQLRAANTANARRRAVLTGLQQLGYQVHEELSTATTAGGRLVMRDAADSNYGVEITAGAAMERLQVRTVALKADRDSSGDIPAEQRWCDDFGSLKTALRKQGSEVLVEKALGVGAVPVKVLVDAGQQEQSRAATAKLASRRL